jgi:hypothetical protein
MCTGPQTPLAPRTNPIPPSPLPSRATPAGHSLSQFFLSPKLTARGGVDARTHRTADLAALPLPRSGPGLTRPTSPAAGSRPANPPTQVAGTHHFAAALRHFRSVPKSGPCVLCPAPSGAHSQGDSVSEQPHPHPPPAPHAGLKERRFPVQGAALSAPVLSQHISSGSDQRLSACTLCACVKVHHFRAIQVPGKPVVCIRPRK